MPNTTTDRRTGARPPCHCTGCGGRRTADASPGWPARSGPAPVLFARRGVQRPIPGERPAGWVDHAYRLHDADTGEWTYVAEPYSLGVAQLGDLAALEAAGWEVVITAGAARHVPGGTLCIRIRQAR